VAGGWRRLHNEELHSLNASPIMRNAYRIVVGKPEGKRRLGRPRNGWEDNIKMNLTETGWKAADWIHLTQDTDQWRAVVNAVMNPRIP